MLVLDFLKVCFFKLFQNRLFLFFGLAGDIRASAPNLKENVVLTKYETVTLS